MSLSGLGFGLFQTPNNRNMLLSAPRGRSGVAGGMQGTARRTGQTSGAVLMTLLFTFASADNASCIGLAVGAAPLPGESAAPAHKQRHGCAEQTKLEGASPDRRSLADQISYP